MQNHASLILGAFVIAISFLVMASLPPRRWIYAIGFAGSLMHLIGVTFFNNIYALCFLDLPGVLLMCVTGVWALRNGIAQMKRSQA
ncbi:hypothetical protein [Granulicella sp. dw_53]|uniref:hypothetical protein n=1 Tax=Granulicella sp. dw_53 TaxID=2719792 RepID=UPI001BD39229|nr:hypothetical protein [Granulicella sp. dw_53]